MPYAHIEDRKAQARRYRERKNELRRVRYREDAEHRTQVLATNAAWRAANPDLVRAHERTQKRRRRGAADAASREWLTIIRGDPCAYCGSAGEHVDHVDPVAHGGSLTWNNLTSACRPCNQHKSDRTMLLFMLETV